jgi:subtilisin family serine protease
MTRSALRSLAVVLLACSCGVGAFGGQHNPAQRSADGDRRVAVLVELSDEPAIAVWSRAVKAVAAGERSATTLHASAQVASQIASIELAQSELMARLQEAQISVAPLYRVQRVLNAIAVRVEPERLAEIAALPGVRRVRRVPLNYPDLSRTVRFIGAPQVWSAAGGGITGTGVKVGLIDTGIDYYHKNFGGTGNYPSSSSFTNASWPRTSKVVGGYDFAGEDGTGDKPDPDPMDTIGHGSHVAGIVGGLGVTSSGGTYAGPYDADANFTTFKVAPGVAPGAQLYALKVFGGDNAAPSEVLIAAIEWAVDPNKDSDFSDRLDVVNLSLGHSYGAPDDPDAEAVDRAAELGVVVVAAAGNDSDRYMITGYPAAATRAISVAASRDDGNKAVGFQINTPSDIAGSWPAGAAAFGGVTPLEGLTGSLAYAEPTDGCAALTNATAVQGKIVLVDRSPDPNNACTFVAKVKNAQGAGALGVVIGNTRSDIASDAVIGMSGVDPTITIPSLFVSRSIREALGGKLPSPGVNLTMTAVSMGDTPTSFSSRGPRRGDLRLKPDIAAPGQSVVSTAFGTATEGTTMSGTSMSAPHVAGVMALLRQRHPDWLVAELKALVMNTATNDLFAQPNRTPPQVGPGRAGAGRVDVPKAAAVEAIAADADEPSAVSLSFGLIDAASITTRSKNLRVTNKSTSELSFTLGYTAVASVGGAAVSFPEGGSVTVAAGSSVVLQVDLTIDPSKLKNSADPGLATFSGNFMPRHWLPEEAGHITLTPASGQAIRVALHAIVRPAGTVMAWPRSLGLAEATGTRSVALVGSGVQTGTSFPVDEVSVVSALELKGSLASGDLSAGDLRYVGVTSDYANLVAQGKGLEDTWLYFGIASYGSWSRPNANYYDDGTGSLRELESDVIFTVAIDTNRDGTFDYLVSNEDAPGDVDSTSAIICSARGTGDCYVIPLNGVEAGDLSTRLFLSNVMVIPVKASWLGLKAGASRFAFKVSTDPDGDTSSNFTFDPAKPAFSFSGTAPVALVEGQPIFRGLPGDPLTFFWNKAALDLDGSKGLLLLHHLNTAETRAQSVPVQVGSCNARVEIGAVTSTVDPLTVTFTATIDSATCEGSPTLEWDFGDGSAPSTLAIPTHTFARTGAYTVRLAAYYGEIPVEVTLRIGLGAGTPPRRRLAGGA